MEMPQTRRENEIWRACDELFAVQASVQRITGDAIRDKLLELNYKKGSPNEIYKYRKSWFESRGINASLNHDQPLVPSDPIFRAVSLVHEQIMGKAQEEIERAKSDSQQKLSDVSKQHEFLKTNYETTIANSVALQTRFDILKEEHENLKLQFDEERKSGFIREERVHFLNQLILEIRSSSTKEIESLLDNISQLNEKMKRERSRAGEEVSNLQVTLHNLNIQNEKTAERAQIIQQQNQSLKIQVKALERQLEKVGLMHKSASQKVIALKTEVALTKKRIIESGKDAALKNKQITKLASLCGELKAKGKNAVST